MADSDEDLNELIRELNQGTGAKAAGTTAAVGSEEAIEATEAVRLDRWLEELVARKGSDLLLVAAAPPSIRTDGRITPLSEPPLAGEEIE
ncbi:MAG TPA: hypothetical protein VGO79_09425, partial [Thermoanaerobaculia bacterium]